MSAADFLSVPRPGVGIPVLLLQFLMAVGPLASGEPEFLDAHLQGINSNPAGFSFRIEFAGPQTHFRVGELIPLNLVYTFDDLKSYLVNDGLYADSGTARLLEVFRVSPEAGTRRETLDQPNYHAWAGGTPVEPRGDRVYRYRVYLNEWRRFDAPGKYRFFGTSVRVWRPDVWPRGDNRLRFTSNVLELEITPATAPWRNEQLRQAVQALAQTENPPERRQALRRLRYLDTETAVCELARRHAGGRDDESFEIGMALTESRHKGAAVEELERRLKAADFTVTGQFLVELASLATDVEIPIDYCAAQPDKQSQDRLAELELKWHALNDSLVAKYAEAAWAAAGSKQPLPWARTVLEVSRFSCEDREYYRRRPIR